MVSTLFYLCISSVIRVPLMVELTNPTQQSPSLEASTSSASQEMSCILWNPKVHYRVHNSPPHVPILSQINPVHPLATDFLMINFNVVVPYTSGIANGLLPSDFPIKTLNAPLLSAIRATCSVHLVFLDLVTRIIFSENKQIVKLLVMQSAPVPCYRVPLGPKYLPPHPILRPPQPLLRT